jgi:predicted nucleic acid-binding protein
VGGNRIILDSGAVSALAAEKGRIRVVLRKAIGAGAVMYVPAAVITETTTGNGVRDAQTNRVLKTCVVLPLDEVLARAAGTLRYRHPKRGAIDAMVVASADALPGTVVITSDAGDLRPIAAERARTTVIDLNG